jgi:hypothetical protein
MSSLVPIAGPIACAGLMGSMMWWMMRGMRGKDTAATAEAGEAAATSAQIAQLRHENALLRERLDRLDPQPASVCPSDNGAG